MRIALIDDSNIIRKLTVNQLKKRCGCPNSVGMGNTRDEIDGFGDFIAADGRFDLILLDWNLDDPETGLAFRTGDEVITDVRTSCERLGVQVPFILVRSANDSAADREEFNRAGADATISKSAPVDILLQHLAEACVLIANNKTTGAQTQSDEAHNSDGVQRTMEREEYEAAGQELRKLVRIIHELIAANGCVSWTRMHALKGLASLFAAESTSMRQVITRITEMRPVKNAADVQVSDVAEGTFEEMLDTILRFCDSDC
jgi:DNA-binding NarL/FixJ family response regulator